MGIREFFNRAKGSDAADVAKAIAELEASKVSARTTLEKAAAARIKGLMSDDDKAVDTADREIERAHRQIERADLALPELRSRLDTLNVKDTTEAAKAFIAEGRKLAAEVEAAVVALLEVNARAGSLYGRARDELGDWDAIAYGLNLISYPGMVNGMGLEAWRNAQGIHAAAPRDYAPRKAPESHHAGQTFDYGANLPSRPKPAPQASPKPIAKPSAPPAAAKPAPKPKARPLPKASPDGKVRVVVVRPGFEAPDGEAHGIGAVLDLPEAQAHEAVRRGAVDFQMDGVAA